MKDGGAGTRRRRPCMLDCADRGGSRLGEGDMSEQLGQGREREGREQDDPHAPAEVPGVQSRPGLRRDVVESGSGEQFIASTGVLRAGAAPTTRPSSRTASGCDGPALARPCPGSALYWHGPALARPCPGSALPWLGPGPALPPVRPRVRPRPRAFTNHGWGRRRERATGAPPVGGAPCGSSRLVGQALGAVMERTSNASSSCSSVSSPRSTKPSAMVASRTEIRSATECLAIFAALS